MRAIWEGREVCPAVRQPKVPTGVGKIAQTQKSDYYYGGMCNVSCIRMFQKEKFFYDTLISFLQNGKDE